MLENEVAIEQNGLDLGKEAVVAVEMRPARLHHADLRIGKVMHNLHKPSSGRHKIGIEDGDKLARCHAQALSQRSRLEAMAIGPVNVGDLVSQGLI